MMIMMMHPTIIRTTRTRRRRTPTTTTSSFVVVFFLVFILLSNVDLITTGNNIMKGYVYGLASIPKPTTKGTATATTTVNPAINLNEVQRQGLVDHANELPDSTYRGGWSNRAGKVLTPVHHPTTTADPSSSPGNNNGGGGVYVADRQFVWNNIDVGGRCTIVQLPQPTSSSSKLPDLWIHSPVSLYEPDNLQSVLSEIGNVKYVVSPNYEHLKYAQQWYDTYKNDDNNNNGSEVSMWGCPGLIERLPNIKWDGEIPDNYRPVAWYKWKNSKKKKKGDDDDNDTTTTTTNPPVVLSNINNEKCWDVDNIIQPIHLNIEVNPFTGKPFFNEVLFYHKPSKTLITTDFYWNYPKSNGITNSQLGYDGSWELAPSVTTIPFGTSLWKFGMDRVYKPFFNTFMVSSKFRNEYNDIIQFLLDDDAGGGWDIETIIPCHGDIIRGKENVQRALKAAFL